MKRKPLSKKVRFDVFKRDSFICQYCGGTPPAIVLEVDHITPVSKGGENIADNLITACFDCNRGKGAEELSVAPLTVVMKAAILAEREDQLKEFNKLLKRKKSHQNKIIEGVEGLFTTYTGMYFSDKFRESIRINFVEKLSVDQLEGAISRACMKCDSPEAASKYFCGICWNIIRGTYD